MDSADKAQHYLALLHWRITKRLLRQFTNRTPSGVKSWWTVKRNKHHFFPCRVSRRTNKFSAFPCPTSARTETTLVQKVRFQLAFLKTYSSHRKQMQMRRITMKIGSLSHSLSAKHRAIPERLTWRVFSVSVRSLSGRGCFGKRLNTFEFQPGDSPFWGWMCSFMNAWACMNCWRKGACPAGSASPYTWTRGYFLTLPCWKEALFDLCVNALAQNNGKWTSWFSPAQSC